MWKFVLLQWLVGLVGVGVLQIGLSAAHAISGMWGLVAVALPNTLFALRLSLDRASAISGVSALLLGEFLIIGATVAMFVVAYKLYPSFIWWAMLLNAVFVLKSYLIAFLLK